ncbi:MAG: hypothetical protein IT385_10280 [Deltaproteobacteria bacterium]|nr:hypothetical protein [Deltaproteobacteria bacterium]
MKVQLVMTTAVVGAVAGVGVGAFGADVNFAGSVQLDYLLVPTDESARDFTFDGFTTELSLKLSADVGDHIAAQVKTCYGCHGFEIGAAYVDFRLSDEVTLRAGRFVPGFGDFPARHDPANHLTSDKPLPYDMGRMLHLRDWNMSILPAPYVDSGMQIAWAPELGQDVGLELSAYVVGGLRASANATDVDFIQSRSGDFYYVDNNSSPTVGGRVAVYGTTGDVTITAGVSAMYGTYDPDNELDLLVLGADLVVRVNRVALRAEYLVRRTKMDLGDNPGETFRYGPGEDGEYDPYFLKQGFYGELTVPAGDLFELVGRVDGMRRQGNVTIASALRSDSVVLRYTLGTNITLARDWRIKLSGEVYDFSDFDDEVGVHLGVVGAF